MITVSRVYLLTKTLIKGNFTFSFGGDSSSDKKKIKKVIMMLLLALAVVYFAGIAISFVNLGYDTLAPLGMESLIIDFATSALTFMVFFFGIFYTISVFYFSKDLVTILPLPIKPGEIILAKFFNTLFYEYLIVLTILLPTLLTYGIKSSSGLLYYFYSFIVAVFLPITPLVIAGIIIMAIMRFAPIVRNKDKFSVFAGVLTLVLILGGNYLFQSTLMNSGEEGFITMLVDKADGINTISSRVFPGINFAQLALLNSKNWVSIFMILGFIITSLIFLGVIYFIGNLVYIPTVTRMFESSSKSEKLNYHKLEKVSKKRNSLITYILKDIRVLVRTPIFFLNNILMNFILPFLFLIPFIVGSGSAGEGSISGLRQMISDELSGGNQTVVIIILLILFGFIVFTSGTNGITESAISREGNCAYVMKIIPMSYTKQITAKILTGLIVSTLGAILFLTIVIISLALPLWMVFLSVLIIPGAILFPNITGMIFDLYNPKIKWDNEQRAVKQNLNIVFGILVSGLFIAIIVVPVIVFKPGLVAFMVYILTLPLALSVASACFVHRITHKCMIQLSA